MNQLDNLKYDYIQLAKSSDTQTLSDKYLFKTVGILDEKYKNLKEHHESFEGLLSNIGSDQKSIALLNYVLKRLKKKKGSLEKNKYYYDFGNTLFSKAVIELNEDDYLHSLIESKTYQEAKRYFLLVKKDHTTHFERASTNLAIIYERYGRNYEAIFTFDRVIKSNPKFGMALGGKAISLEYYTRLAPQQSLLLLNVSYNLLKEALEDENLRDVGGDSSFTLYGKRRAAIEKYFEQINYKPKKISLPKGLSNYQKFILKNNLFLNYDSGYYYDKDSLCDNFFPNLKESINDKKFDKSSIMSGKVYFCFQIFNQLFEDYTTARYNYYRALHVKHKRIDRKVKYIYTFDYTQHSLKYGMLKSVFSSLYNCLDKIAHITKFYFSNSEIEFNNIDIYFDWLTRQEFKQIIKENGNFQLLALYNLAIDFKNNGPNYGLNRIRNRITHSFLNINVEISFDEKYSDFEITEGILIDGINNLFVLVKSAIMYTLIAIRHTGEHEKTMPMYATMQNDIYK